MHLVESRPRVTRTQNYVSRVTDVAGRRRGGELSIGSSPGFGQDLRITEPRVVGDR